MTDRTRATILTELAEVERHLRDAPPHHGAGVRDDLERRRDALRRELSRSAASGRDDGPVQGG